MSDAPETDEPAPAGLLLLHVQTWTAYLREFRRKVLKSYARTAATVLQRAGKPPEIWRDLDTNPQRVRRVVGPQWRRLDRRERAHVEQRWQRPVPRVETPLWAAARVLSMVDTALTVGPDADIDQIRRLDLAILTSGNAGIAPGRWWDALDIVAKRFPGQVEAARRGR